MRKRSAGRPGRSSRRPAEIYNDIYFVDEPDLTGTDHITSLDGTHPDDLGYWRWANAIQPRIVKILKKYGIR